MLPCLFTQDYIDACNVCFWAKMTTQAVRLFRKMDGLFAVYKPHGVHWKHVRDSIESSLLKGSVCVTCEINAYR